MKRVLIANRGEIALHRIRTPERTIGILYNFRFRGRELTYQSGFAYDTKRPRLKPGMTCHRLAIEAAARAGLSCYDFLAGADRYKRSLADSQENLEWLEIGPAWSPPLIARRLRDRFSRVQEPR